jgi:hypothetical protein
MFKRLRKLIARETNITAGIAGATWGVFGAAAAGPRGALTSAAAALITPYITDPLLRRIHEARVADLLEPLEVAGVTPDRLRSTIEADESVWDLCQAATEAALHTASERKRRTLGHALARGVLSDAGWAREHELRVIQGISVVEASDLLVLDHMMNTPAHDVTAPRARQPTHLEAGSVEEGELKAAFDNDMLDIILENLTSTGLLWSPGIHIAGAVFSYKPTALGRAVWQAFKDAGDA